MPSLLPLYPRHNIDIMKKCRITKEIWWFSSPKAKSPKSKVWCSQKYFCYICFTAGRISELVCTHFSFIHSLIQQLLSTFFLMCQALFCILGDKSKQNKGPVSNGIYLVSRETEIKTGKHICNI